jgi:predicted transcriptional regulator
MRSLLDLTGRTSFHFQLNRNKRTTIFLSEEIVSDLVILAMRRKEPLAALVRVALKQFVGQEKKERPGTLSFVGIAAAGGGTRRSATKFSCGERRPRRADGAAGRHVQAVADGEVVAQDLTSADWDRLLELMGMIRPWLCGRFPGQCGGAVKGHAAGPDRPAEHRESASEAWESVSLAALVLR